MAKIKITYEFDYHEEGEEASRILKNPDAFSILWDIDQEIRNKLKHGEEDWLQTGAYEYLENLRTIIREEGILNE
jgi:hypothetical protein